MLIVLLVYYFDLLVGLPFGWILGQNGLAQGFNVKPMRPAQAIKRYPQPYVCSNLQSFLWHFPWDALGGPEKDQVLVCVEECLRFILHGFSWLAGCPWA